VSEIVREGDLATFFWLNRSAKNQWLDVVMPLVTHLGGFVWCVVLSLSFLIHPAPHWHAVGVELALSLGLSHAIVALCKKVLPRTRPYLALENVSTGRTLWKDASFPSGHTTAAFATATVLMSALPDLAVLIYALALTVGSSRIYLGQHYPSDVIIGAMIGTITASLIV
jgi:undecaprenyl-diphosphatase